MTFLQRVAQDILNKYGNDLTDIAVVFPNKRAALFLNQELARQAGKPVWSPAYITISELFRQHSPLTVADPIQAICILYRCFQKFIQDDTSGETLDQFYGWGQLLLADFDDLDKNMADAKRVFSHVQSLEQMADLSYLTEEQKKALARFFKDFDEQATQLKTRFISLWDVLFDIYDDYRTTLRRRQLAYEGMLYRDVAEMPHIDFRYRKYLFVGFNVIQQVEQTIFRRLKEEGRAAFYWDYDHYYVDEGKKGTKGNEAGVYIRQYLNRFPNELPDDDALYRQLSQPKDITFISAATENLQAHYVSEWLQAHRRIADGSRTAVVMCNEGLLTNIIHCIPDSVKDVNITTGYPLQQTRIATDVIRKMNEKGMPADNIAMIAALKEFVKGERGERSEERGVSILDDQTTNPPNDQTTKRPNDQTTNPLDDQPLEQEALFRMYTLLNRMESLLATNELLVDMTTLQRLLRQLIATTSIPFHGEPAVGLQVMGVLETRNLDFDHVLILSCNEGNMPKGVNDSSFIPHIIRQAYGLTTIDNKVAIYSYYFHRLIQRAHDVTVLYSNATEGVQTGEMSRFMLQLLVELGKPIRQLSLSAGGELNNRREPLKVIAKDNPVLERLSELNYLAPTALSNYLRCQLRFYYRYVCELKEPDEDNEGKIDNRIFGNVFHRAAQLMYENLLPRHVITADDIDKLLNRNPSSTPFQAVIDQAIAEELFKLPKGTATHPPLNGMQLISVQVVETYLRQLLRIDRRLTPFRVVMHEKDVSRQFPVPTSEGSRMLTLGGRIDRIDLVGGTLRIVDYKTGNSQQQPVKELADVFKPENVRTKHTDYYLQAMFYSRIVEETEPLARGKKVSPALLFIQHAGGEDYSPVLCIGKQPIDDMAVFAQPFDELLATLLSEIFDPSTDFQATTDLQRCLSCPYRMLCGR